MVEEKGPEGSGRKTFRKWTQCETRVHGSDSCEEYLGSSYMYAVPTYLY